MGIALNIREQKLMSELTNALSASLNLHEVLNNTYPLILPLIGADYSALAVTRSDREEEYEWIFQHLPPAFLASYDAGSTQDFVRDAVMSKINVVVRDADMLDRKAYGQSFMYRHGLDVGVRIEQVMAVMLHAGDGLQSGLSLYRDRPRPFTARDQHNLQQITPLLGNAVRNCRLFTKVERRGSGLDVLLASEQRAVVFVHATGRELDRSSSATSFLNTWFTPVERGAGHLPGVLIEQLAHAQAAHARGAVNLWRWTKTDKAGEATLRVEFVPVPESISGSTWMLTFSEKPHTPQVPAAWTLRLTKTEIKVLSKMLLATDYRVIADDMGITRDTVKVHVKHILDKLGFPSGKALIAQAMREA